MGVYGEGDADDLSVPAVDLEAIGGLALVGGWRDDGARMRAERPSACLGLKQQ